MVITCRRESRYRSRNDRPGAIFAEQALHAADGEALVIEQSPNGSDQLYIFRPVVAAPATALQRMDLRKLCLPEAKNMLRDMKFVRYLTDCAKSIGRFLGT